MNARRYLAYVGLGKWMLEAPSGQTLLGVDVLE